MREVVSSGNLGGRMLATKLLAPKNDFLVRPAVFSGMMSHIMKVLMAKTEMKVKAADFCHSERARYQHIQGITSMLDSLLPFDNPTYGEDDHGHDVPKRCRRETQFREPIDAESSQEDENPTDRAGR